MKTQNPNAFEWEVSAYTVAKRARLSNVRRLIGTGELLDLFSKDAKGENDYSLKPFVRSNSLFVHIPKTAGMSIARALYGCLGLGHASLAEYRRLLRPRALSRMFKFTFVRNPFDRIHSAYHFLASGGVEGVDATFNEEVLSKFRSFEHFILEGLERDEVASFWHFRSSSEFLSYVPGEPVDLNFIGRFETLDRDFDFVRSRVNPRAALGRSNFTGPKRDYRKEFTAEMIARVSHRYSTDLQLFGYDFEGATGSPALAGDSQPTIRP